MFVDSSDESHVDGRVRLGEANGGSLRLGQQGG